jgi:hypothetical protein
MYEKEPPMFVFDFVAHVRQLHTDTKLVMERLLQQHLSQIFGTAAIHSSIMTGHTVMMTAHCADRDPRFAAMPLEEIAAIVQVDLQTFCEQEVGEILIDLAYVTYALSQEQRRTT